MPYPGLSLRVSYGGGKSWVFFSRHGGRHRRMTLGRYPANARTDGKVVPLRAVPE